MQKLLTVIVPVSLMVGKLDRLVSWVVSMRSEDLAIIIVHDFKDLETSLELHEKFSNQSNVQIIEGRFGSPGLARNAGLTEASTEWVAFVDSDDLPEMMLYFKAIRDCPIDTQLIVGKYDIVSSKTGNAVSSRRIKNPYLDLAVNGGFWRCIYRRVLIEQLRFNNFKLGEDLCFLVDVMQLSPKIFVTHSVLYRYYVDQASSLTAQQINFTFVPKVLDKAFRLLPGAKGDFKFFLENLIARLMLSSLTRRSRFITFWKYREYNWVSSVFSLGILRWLYKSLRISLILKIGI